MMAMIYAQRNGDVGRGGLKPLNVFHPPPEQLIVRLVKGQEVIRWKILRKADEWELHYNLMLVPFLAVGAFVLRYLSPASKLLQY